ncbi:hypothetical protein MACJ_002102 [Theileria orientalis]|uniref:Uncharacterized protein n=1 Tax=Theileria orientalis TaxID=68886 RepID=A0A976M5M8_THEOR|nr:hypothetical protein MACJ_002102 [Theileria orientalis]
MATFKLAVVFYLLLLGAYAKNTSHSSQEILQSNGVRKGEAKSERKTETKTEDDNSQERCDMEPDNKINEQFTKYVREFTDSDSGKLLKDMISTGPMSKLSRPITNLLEKVDKGHIERLKRVAKEPYDLTWNIVNLVLSAIYTVVLAYLTMFYPLSNYTILTISAYVLCSVVMGLCHDIFPLWAVAMFGVVGDILVWFLLSLLDNVKRRQICVLSACMVFSKMVYDLHAVIPLDFISPNYTGICGILVNYTFRSNSFIFLRILYLVFLIFLTGSIFIRLPSFVAGDPMELQEIDVGATIMKRLICFVSALPAAGFCNQLYCTIRKIANPLGPMTYFVIPTKFRLEELGSYVAVASWALFSITYYELIKHSNENQILTPPKKRRSWRAYTRTISRL